MSGYIQWNNNLSDSSSHYKKKIKAWKQWHNTFEVFFKTQDLSVNQFSHSVVSDSATP